MSLRYKALIAAIVLVSLVTGVLVYRAGQGYEDAERARINQQLRADARSLNAVLDARVKVVGATLKFAAQSSELVRLIREDAVPLAGNFTTFTREWADASQADIAIAGIEPFTAEDRGADLLHKGQDLALVGMHVREGFSLNKSQREALVADPELNRRLAAAFAEAEKSSAAMRKTGKAGPAPATSLVMAVESRVYLVVFAPLYDSLQEFTVIGVGAALVELDSAWLRDNFKVSGSGADVDADESVATIYKLVYTQKAPTASTYDDRDGMLQVFTQSRGTSDELFEFGLGENGERFLGLRVPFAQAPADLADRPGFIPFKSLDRELIPLRRLREDISWLGVSLGVLASLLAYLTAYSVIRRIRRLQAATNQVREGKFDTRVEDKGRDELGALGKAFNDMTTGLKALGMYTHDTLAKNVLDKPELLGKASTREEGSIFFSDVKGFTSISEKLSAEELTNQLNEYFAALGHKLRDTRGYVDKFIGDGIMAFWGKPFVTSEDYATRACTAALECLKAGAELRAKWKAEGKPQFFQRIGVATGFVVVGNIGTDTKKNFTVIGDSVNLASRLEGANKVYGTEVLVDARTAELSRGQVLFREIDQIVVVGKTEPVRIFEPLAILGQGTGPIRAHLALYEQALAAYRQRDFKAAVGLLDQFSAKHPGDEPAKWLAVRCRELINHPPGKEWRPVTEATSK